MKTESLADLLREARRDWIRDTEWVGDQYGGVEQPTGAALRAFGARIDAALSSAESNPTSNQRNALVEIRERAYRLARINCPDDCCDWTHPLCWIARTADAALKGVPLPESPAETSTAQAAWDAVNALIKEGPLPGNGWDKQAERNGLILAANTIASLPGVRTIKPLPEKTSARRIQIEECSVCGEPGCPDHM